MADAPTCARCAVAARCAIEAIGAALAVKATCTVESIGSVETSQVDRQAFFTRFAILAGSTSFACATILSCFARAAGSAALAMVFGDSVVNGGGLTDHENLATSILTNERVVYANISAGSWGPQNMAAYWAEFREKLPYRKAILVLSSHDYTDIPTFAPLDPRTPPTETPALALLEGAFSYLPRYLPDSWFNDPGKSAERFRNEADRAQPGEQAIHKLIDQFRRDGVSLCVVRHYTLSEMGTVPETGDLLMAMAIAKHSLPLVDLRKHYPPNVPRKTFFRDDIHFNASGQTILAKAVAQCASFLD